MKTTSLADKFSESLSHFPLVSVWIQADKCQGLPGHLKGQVRLLFGVDMAIPIPDLCVDESGVSGTLSFGRIPHFVVIPWHGMLGFMDDAEASRLIAEGKFPTEGPPKDKTITKSRVVSQDGNVVRVRFGK